MHAVFVTYIPFPPLLTHYLSVTCPIAALLSPLACYTRAWGGVLLPPPHLFFLHLYEMAIQLVNTIQLLQ